MASTDLHFTIRWDSEPSEQAQAFVKLAVLEALREIVTDTAWLKEIVQAEVHKAFQAEAKAQAEVHKAFQAEAKAINERIGSVRRD